MRNADEKSRQKHEGDLIQYVTDIEKRRQGLENGRLLYVAATRAIHGLHLLATANTGKEGDVKPTAGTLLGELWPAIEAGTAMPREIAGTERVVEEPGAVSNDEPAPSDPALPQLYRRLAADWQLPERPAPIEMAPAGPPELRDFIEFQWAGEGARLAGNLVHRLLQLIAALGIGPWQDSGGMARRENWCRLQLSREGVVGEKADALTRRIAHAIESCLQSDRGQWLLGPREHAESEYALSAVLAGQPVNLVLDRTFVDDGTRWIIDYKTSSHRGGDLEGFLQNEAERYREQLARYRQAMALGDSRPIRTALYFPLLDRFCEVET